MATIDAFFARSRAGKRKVADAGGGGAMEDESRASKLCLSDASMAASGVVTFAFL
jgi:hypothetical protein